MIALAIPTLKDTSLYTLLRTLARKAIDGTVVPLVVDYVNQRILVGAAAATTTTPGKVEVTGGDLKIVDVGKGVTIKSPNGSLFRITVDNDGALVTTALAFLMAMAPVSANAQSKRALMEATTSTLAIVYVDTHTARINISTAASAPLGGLANVGLHIASNAVVSSSASGGKIVLYATGTVAAVEMSIGGIRVATTTLPTYFESAEQTVTANTVVSVAHGLGGIPKWFQATLRCKTAEHGYAIDDELLITVATNLVGGDNPNVFVNATNIGFTVDEGIGGMSRATAAGTQFTGANWRIVLRAWR